MCNKEKQKVYFFRELLIAIGIGIVVFLALYLFLWFKEINKYNFIMYFSISLLYSITGYIPNKYLAVYLNNTIPWDKYPKSRLVYGIIWGFILTIIVFISINYLQALYFGGYSIGDYFAKMSFSQFKLPIYISIVMFLSFYLFYFYKEVQELKIKEANLQTENAKAKYNAIKNQIDPHFLFNNLNVLYSIIDENPKNAKKFIKDLSAIYRYILEHKDTDLVFLDNEIEFAKKYLDLLKFRFEESLDFKIDIDDDNKKIVPLALQILLENAIKHNKITDEEPLFIKIFVEDNYLIVENNYNPILDEKSTKTGLKSINDRCKYLMNKEIVVEKMNGKFRVKVPINKT